MLFSFYKSILHFHSWMDTITYMCLCAGVLGHVLLQALEKDVDDN